VRRGVLEKGVEPGSREARARGEEAALEGRKARSGRVPRRRRARRCDAEDGRPALAAAPRAALRRRKPLERVEHRMLRREIAEIDVGAEERHAGGRPASPARERRERRRRRRRQSFRAVKEWEEARKGAEELDVAGHAARIAAGEEGGVLEPDEIRVRRRFDGGEGLVPRARRVCEPRTAQRARLDRGVALEAQRELREVRPDGLEEPEEAARVARRVALRAAKGKRRRRHERPRVAARFREAGRRGRAAPKAPAERAARLESHGARARGRAFGRLAPPASRRAARRAGPQSEMRAAEYTPNEIECEGLASFRFG
jgi:hypothetical protein